MGYFNGLLLAKCFSPALFCLYPERFSLRGMLIPSTATFYHQWPCRREGNRAITKLFAIWTNLFSYPCLQCMH